MDLLEVMQKRRSVRAYTDQSIPMDTLEKVIQAGLLSASSRSIRPWELLVVREKKTLDAMSQCRIGSAKMLKQASCAIVVLADEKKSDVWVEDCSIVMANMHLMANSLGIGSCWIQGRLREAPDGRSTEDYLRSLLHFPPHMRLEAVLSMGMPAEYPEPHTIESLPNEKVHWDIF